MRFALDALRGLAGTKVGKVLLPQSGAEAAMMFLPNLAFAGMAGAYQPEGTDLGTRIGAVGEDFLGSTLAQMAGRPIGYGIGRGFGAMRGRPLSPEKLGMLTNMGEMATELGAYPFLPRPFASSALSKYEEELTRQQQEQQAARDEEVRRQALAEAGALGYLMPPQAQELFYG